MKSKLTVSICILSLFFSFSNCTLKAPKSNNNPSTISDLPVQLNNSSPNFTLPEIPILLKDEQERAIYLSKHFWDLFPFSDTTLFSRPDITEQGLVDYLNILNKIPYPDAEESLKILMNRAKSKASMYEYFASLCEKYLYDPNSPFRNDEFYIPVVENLLQSEMLTETQQVVYGFQHEMILKNRVGTKATDFVYTLATGDKKNMHSLKSDYLILYFSNPDCFACVTTTHEIDSSTPLHHMFMRNNSKNNILTVLSIYPDSNIDEWHNSLPTLPQKNWVNGYDDGTIINKKRLYDIKAIPTLYLLNKYKEIILKDTSLEKIEKYFVTKE